MGLQLIFAVETNKKCNSDWIYIKDTIEHFIPMTDTGEIQRCLYGWERKL